MKIFTQPSIFTREDTFLGICQALGEDFGFNPNWLRILIAVSLYFAPAVVIGSYLGAGVIVLVSRWLAPDPAVTLQAEHQPAEVEADAEPELAIAA